MNFGWVAQPTGAIQEVFDNICHPGDASQPIADSIAKVKRSKERHNQIEEGREVEVIEPRHYLNQNNSCEQKVDSNPGRCLFSVEPVLQAIHAEQRYDGTA